MIRVSDLRMLDVVNVVDGRRLGPIKDVDLDVEAGKIKSLILPTPSRFWSLWGKNDDLEVPWDKVKVVGVDVILVEVPTVTEPKHERILAK